jgi:uncharacterized membrane protein
VILALLFAVNIPFDIKAIRNWVKQYENLKLLLSLLRPTIAFTCLYFGIYCYILSKRVEKDFKSAGGLIFIGACFSVLYISEVLNSTYYLHRIHINLLPPSEFIRTKNMMVAANVYFAVIAIIFLAVTACFVVMLKKLNAQKDTEQLARPDGE